MAHTHFSIEQIAAWLEAQQTSVEAERMSAEIDDCQQCQSLLECVLRGDGDIGLAQASAGELEKASVSTLAASNTIEIARKMLDVESLELLREIASGGQGVVFEARDHVLRRRVAVKLVHPKFGCGTIQLRRLLREADIAGRLEHPGIVPIYNLFASKAQTDSDNSGGSACIVMRFLPKSRLDLEIATYHRTNLIWHSSADRKREFRQLISRLVQVCEAIGYAHSQGVIHGDIKPSNILVGEFGETLVCDWGLSHLLDDVSERPAIHAESNWRTDPFEVLSRGNGTPGFMSPEQAGISNEPVRQGTDIYAIGGVLYQILTGKKPRQIVSRGAYQNPVFPSSMPTELVEIVRKAMQFDPADRYLGEEERIGYGLPTLDPQTKSVGGAKLIARALQDWLDATAPVQELLDERNHQYVQVENRLAKSRVQLRGVQLLTVLTAIASCIIIGLAWVSREQALKDKDQLSSESQVLSQQIDSQKLQIDATEQALDNAGFQVQSAILERAVFDWTQKRYGRVSQQLNEVTADDFSVRFLRNATLKPAATLLHSPPDAAVPHHAGAVLAVQYSEDGRQFHTWGADGRLITWDSTSLKPILAKSINDAPVPGDRAWDSYQLFSPDGLWLAITFHDETLATIWLIRTSDGFLAKSWQLPLVIGSIGVMSLDFSVDGQRFMFAGFANDSKPDAVVESGATKIIVTDLATLNETHKLTPSDNAYPFGIVFTADGDSLIGSGCGTVDPAGCWSLTDETHSRRSLPYLRTPDIGGLARVSNDGSYLITVGSGSLPYVHTGDGSRSLLTLPKPNLPTATTFSADSALFAVASFEDLLVYSSDDWLLQFDATLDPPAKSSVIDPQRWRIRSMVFSHSNDRLLCATDTGVYSVDLTRIHTSPFQRLISLQPEVIQAIKWNDDQSYWCAYQAAGHFAVRKFGANHIPRTLLDNSLVQSSVPMLSQDASRLFIGRRGNDVERICRIEQWTIDETPINVWANDPNAELPGNYCQPIAAFAGDLGVLMESHWESHSASLQAKSPPFYKSWAPRGNWGTPYALGKFQILQASSPDSFLLTSSQFGGSGVAATIYSAGYSTRGAPRLNQRIVQAKISDDEKLLAAYVVKDNGEDVSQGYLALFQLPQLREIARLDYPLSVPLDFGIDFSPNNSLIAIGTTGGQLLVWDPLTNTKIDIRYEEGTKEAALESLSFTGVAFNADGSRLIFSAYDSALSSDYDRWNASESGHIGIALLPLDDAGQLIADIRYVNAKFLQPNSGPLLMGKHAANRTRLPLVHMTNGQMQIWDITEERLLTTIEYDNGGKRDERWLELASIDYVTSSSDDGRVALAGPLTKDPNIRRIVILDTVTGHVVDHIDTSFHHVDDLRWQSSKLNMLANSIENEASNGPSLVAYLGSWTPDNPGVVQKSKIAKLAQCAWMSAATPDLLPCFSPDGQKLLLPVPNESAAGQCLAIFDSHSLLRLQQHVPQAHCVLNAFEWGHTDAIAISCVAAEVASGVATSRYHRYLQVWDPDRDQLLLNQNIETYQSPKVDFFGDHPVLFITLSKDGESLLTHRYRTQELEVWSLKHQQRRLAFPIHEIGNINRLEFLPDGLSLLVSGDQRAEILVGNTISPQN